MDANELEIWIELKPGKAVRIRLSVFEEGLPSPGESDNQRQPYLGEILMTARRLNADGISLHKPF